MFINSIGHYLPHHTVPNDHFEKHFGILSSDITDKSGIRERRKALSGENTNTMALEAVTAAAEGLPYAPQQVDLVIGATYTPFDTVGTLAHTVQQQYNIGNAKVFSISSACSSMVNAVEIADSFFKTGKATKALIVASEHNTAYYNESDKASGFLWGDGAAAFFLSKERYVPGEAEILDVSSSGHGHIGKSISAVWLRPLHGGLRMPSGHDVFQTACLYMQKEAEDILEKNGIPVTSIRYLIPHQANLRIIDYVRKSLDLREDQIVVNLDKLGNTGCASSLIGLSQIYGTLNKGDIAVITVFGGGYSSGAILVRK
jgi:3-oxoacyl-[acyl-carrier-protein] synthase-3